MTFDQFIACPICGCGNLHPNNVIVWRRDEDAPSVRLEIGAQIPVTTSCVEHAEDNPSPRREAIEIRFWCEGDHHVGLLLVQHKGPTYAWWRERPDVPVSFGEY